MIDKNKTDAVMGMMIQRYLILNNVETPVKIEKINKVNNEEKINIIEKNFINIMDALGLDLTDDSLKDTPKRIGKMFVNEIFAGLDYRNFPKCTTVENKFNYDEFIIEKDINVQSFCEHHFVNIYGKAVVAYKPSTKVIGLSKLNRITEFFSRRPQIQERLTEQIFYTLKYLLKTEDIAVIINAEHLCVKARGVEDVNASTITSKIGGIFSQPTSRMELMNLIK